MAAVESRKRRTERLTPRGHRREEREADGERGRREMDRVLAGQAARSRPTNASKAHRLVG